MKYTHAAYQQRPPVSTRLLLGDKIYQNRHPGLTPYTAVQLVRKHEIFRRKCLSLNSF